MDKSFKMHLYKMRSALYSLLLVALFGALVVSSCTKETVRIEGDDPGFDNPFEGINNGEGSNPINIDSASFLGIYNNILKTKCGANEGACHDGSFEPDYRTLFSAYNTLVYQQPIKNIVDEIIGQDTLWVFPYRVTPGDPDASWLHYRVTTDDENLGRMPLYDQALSEAEVDNIREWILDGAPDPFGNLPSNPPPEPLLFGVMAFEGDQNGPRLDTSRANILEPMVFPQNTAVDVWIGAVDYSEDGQFLLAPFGYSKMKISDHPTQFEDEPELTMETEIFNVVFGPPTLFDPNAEATLPYYHHYTMNTADFEPGTIYYMRVYLQGSTQDTPTEIPENESVLFWHTFMSFVVEE